MASLKLEHIYKVYPNGTKAVNDFTMDIEDKEFIVFVGPSGCGKSTTLRMIAGLEEISSGELYIGNQIVNDMEPKDRDIAMVFQNYALYPHMTVYENMAFGLQLRHVPRAEIHEKVMWAAKVLGLTEYLDRKPKAMSGGQRQRVSLGRAILRNPKVMLLDEPLSNLDAKLRSQMRSEISKLHQNLKTTFIYVTHDQVEAMTLGTRVVVMKLGRVQQIDAPKNLYDYPVNKFVAGFIGTPQMNFFDTTLTREKDVVHINFKDVDAKLDIKFENLLKVQKQYFDGERPVILGIRCENISLADKKDKNTLKMKINHFEELGNEALVYGDLDLKDDLIIDSPTKVIVKVQNTNGLKIGDVVDIKFDIAKAHFFDAKTEMTISPRLPEVNVFDAKVKGDTLHFLGNDIPMPSAISLDNFEGSLVMPVNAIHVAKDGLAVKVEKIETINKKHLAYLRCGEHLFFALVDNKVNENDEIFVTFDYEKASFYKDEELVLAPLVEKDQLKATFTNYQTILATEGKNETYEAEAAQRVEEAVKPILEKMEALKLDHEKVLADINSRNVEAEAKEKLEASTKLAQEKQIELANAKQDYLKAKKEVKLQYKDGLKQAKKEVNEMFAKRLLEEKQDYAKSMSLNKDKGSRRARKADHATFMENLPREKEGELKNRVLKLEQEYDANINGVSAEYQRKKYEIKSEIKEAKKAYKKALNPIAFENAAYEKQLAVLKKELALEEKRAGLLFFLKINGSPYILPNVISNKIIQGLGSKVFTKTYRLEIPHNAFVLDDNGTMEGKVLDKIVYSKYNKYYRVSTIVDGVENIIYIKTNNNLEVNSTVRFTIDLLKTEIYESSLNIRLY